MYDFGCYIFMFIPNREEEESEGRNYTEQYVLEISVCAHKERKRVKNK